MVWEELASTGGYYLILSNNYYVNSNYGYVPDFQDYEEVWLTHTANGAPNFDFYFYNQYWVSTNGTSYVAKAWVNYTWADPSYNAVIPSGVAVVGMSENRSVSLLTPTRLAVIKPLMPAACNAAFTSSSRSLEFVRLPSSNCAR